ncbi:MAG: PilZ domain-containing protein, partial [Lysobacterales bacterium]
MQPAPARQAILPLNLKDKAALYKAYMSGVRGGGLFIPTSQPFRLGDEIFVLLHLEDVQERLPVAGRVIWLTPAQAHSP